MAKLEKVDVAMVVFEGLHVEVDSGQTALPFKKIID